MSIGYPKIFCDVHRLVVAAEKLAADCAIVSWDLFDTLLVRRIADPDQIKEPVARYIAARAAQCGVQTTWQEVLHRRSATERRHREMNGARFPDSEAIYPEFMGEMLQELFGERLPKNLLADVTEFELRLESAVLVPRQTLLALLQRLRAQGKRIWVLTDIYLPSTHIHILLERCGLLGLIDGFVSSADECCAKASGAGFRRLQERLQCDFSRWMHIGDNFWSDGLRPAELGIRALVLRDRGEKRRKCIYRLHQRMAGSVKFWRGRFWRELAKLLEAERDGREALYWDGYNFFGPLALAFVKHVAEEAVARKLKRVYFFAREGRAFLQIWQKAFPYWFPCVARAPEARYLAVSRLALAPAACAQQGLTHANAPLALLPARNRDLRDVCRVFGLDVAGLTGIFKKHDLMPDAPLNPIYAGWTEKGWHSFDQLLRDEEFQAAVRTQTADCGRLLERYLEQECFFEQPDVGVVDIGWLGTIQRFLFDAIVHRRDCPRLHGFLFAATRGIPYPTTPQNAIEGFFYDRQQHEGVSGVITNALEIFEEAYREPAAGIIGYAENNGKIVPVRMPEEHPARMAEIRQDEYFAPLRQGILDFAERGAAAFAILDYSAADVRPWLEWLLVRRMAFPTIAEVKRLRWRHHLDEYDGCHRPPWRIRLRLTTLWGLPLPVLRLVPGVRLAFFAWRLLGLPLARYAYRRIQALRQLAAEIGRLAGFGKSS